MLYKCKYFGIKELVSKIVYNHYISGYGESFIWGFFDADVLKDLDAIRESWGRAIIINNWSIGGTLTQCGLRSNADPMLVHRTTPYLSAHTLAKGFDLHDVNGQNKALHNHVAELIKSGKLKTFHRLENFKDTPTWVHVDAFQTLTGGLEIF